VIAERHQQRRHAAKPQLAIDALGELSDGPKARLAPGLGERPSELDLSPLAEPSAEPIHELARRETLIPNVKVTLLGKAAHALAILAHALFDNPATAARAQPDVAAGELGACRHALEVPLPRTGQRLVEVVGAEDDPTVGGCESAEVRDVSVAARLHDDPRIGGVGEVSRHHGRRAAVKREW